MKKLVLFVALISSVAAHAQLGNPIANDGSTGTVLNKLVKLTGSPSTAVIAGTSDTAGIVGICVSGCGTVGTSLIAYYGTAGCVFDNTTVAGHYVQIASGVAGDCHDAGSTRPTSGQIIGFVKASGAAGTYDVLLNSAETVPGSLVTPVTVPNGGTGIAAGTSGGVLCYTASTTIASSGALTANQPIAGGGAGVCPSTATMVPATLTDGTTITWAIASNPFATATVTLGGNRTLNITNPVSGGTYTLEIVQDGTGSRTLALGTGCTWKVSGGGSGAITLSTAINSVDLLVFQYNGTTCKATLTKNFN